MADLSAASLDDVSAFFRTYYSPNNASLCIAGDFEPDEAKALVEKYFGPLPAGPEVAKIAARGPRPRRAQAHHDDRPRLAARVPSSSGRPSQRGHADEPALDVLADDPRAARQGEPALPRLDVRPATRRQRLGVPPGQRPGGHVQRRRSPPGPASSSTSWSPSPTPRSSGSRPTGRPTDEVAKAQNTQESQLDHRPPVGRPQGRLPQQLQRRVRRPAGLQGRDGRALRRHAGRRQAGGQPVPDRQPGPARRQPGPADPAPGRGRGRSRERRRPLDSPKVAEVKDDVRPLDDAEGRPEPRVHPAAGRAPEALQRAGGPDRRAARAADPDPEPGRQGGRDARPRRQGRARLD